MNDAKKNYVTPGGYEALKRELRILLYTERPPIVDIVSWAASNGDRSENGDYVYGKKRLREIDRRVHYLTKQIETAEVIDPAKQQHLKQVFFGATVHYIRNSNSKHIVSIVGADEADASLGKISWLSPLARALMKACVGDHIIARTPGGDETINVISLHYT